MAFITGDRVKETSTTTGTGDFTLDGAASGFKAFGDLVSVGDTVYYAIYDETAGDFEVGEGSFPTATNTLQRDVVLSSSNSDTLVNFAAGAKVVFLTAPADKFLQITTSDNLTPPTLGSVDINATTIDLDATVINIDGSSSVSIQDNALNVLTLNSLAVVNYASEFVATTGTITPTLFPSNRVMIFGGFSSNGYVYSGADGFLHIGNNGAGVSIDVDSGGDFQVTNNLSASLIEADGVSTRLYDNGILSAYTSGSSFTVVGTVFANGLDMGDSDEIRLGTGDDTRIDFDGTNYIHNQIAGDMVFQNNGSDAMRLDSSGRLSLGSAGPLSWPTTYSVFEIGAAGAIWSNTSSGTPQNLITSNIMFDGSDYRLINDGSGAMFWQSTSNSTAPATIIYAYTGATGTAGEVATGTPIFKLWEADNTITGTLAQVYGELEADMPAFSCACVNNVNVTGSAGVKAVLDTANIGINRGPFTASTTYITIPEDGWYCLYAHIRMDSAVARIAPQVLWYRTTPTVTNLSQYAATGYIRVSGHDESSLHPLTYYELSSGDQVGLYFRNEGAAGTANTVGSASIQQIFVFKMPWLAGTS
jgi:hypothetical protein